MNGLIDQITWLVRNDRQIRFLIGLLVAVAVSFALPTWSVFGTMIYSFGLGWRA